MTWTIRLKFLIVMCTLLVVCLGAYLAMAITVFKSDKTQLVYDLNRSQVSNLTSELETQFGGVSDKLRLFALLPSELQNRMVEDLFTSAGDIVSVSIFKTDDQQVIRSFAQSKFLETYGLEKSYFDQVVKETKIPFEEILKNGQDIWNASLASGPPLIGYGRLVVVQDQSGRAIDQWAVVGFVKLDRFIKSVSIVRLSQIFVANQRGEVLVQPEAAELLKHPKMIDEPIFKEAKESKSRVSLVNREINGTSVLAAYAKGFNDQFLVIAKASEGEAFRVVREFTIRTFLFSAIVLTLVILAAFLLSRSLTENIGLLVDRMALVSEGDLSTHINLKSHDETRTLANTFNRMIEDLRESRDQLEEMNRDLDLKVQERTAQIEEQNKKIKEVQEALIRTTRLASVGEIAGRTAHEVLNPLTILLTRLGLMQKRLSQVEREPLGLMGEIQQAWVKDFSEGGFDSLLKAWQAPSQIKPEHNLFEEDLENLGSISAQLKLENENLKNDVRFIKEEGERIGKIVNAMRRMGHLKSQAAPQSIHTILKDCCAIMKDLFAEKSIEISQVYLAKDDLASVDRDEMVQAITNLMRNSLQALEDAKVKNSMNHYKMTIRTLTEQDRLLIEIEDNGVGIPVDLQNKLFEASFTTKSPDVGTGLGLGISRRFVRNYGGEIEFLSSIPYTKTVFRIVLPLEARSNQGAVA